MAWVLSFAAGLLEIIWAFTMKLPGLHPCGTYGRDLARDACELPSRNGGLLAEA